MISGGFLGVSLLFLSQILAQSRTSLPLHIAIHSFAIAVPFSTISVAIIDIPSIKRHPLENPGFYLPFLLGFLASLIGVAAVFFHLSLTSFILFVICSLFCLVFVGLFHKWNRV
jgi:hypothetical protein